MLAALGLFVFDMASFPFADATRARDWRHAAAQRVGARDGAQFTGPGDDVVTLAGCIVPGVAGAFAAIETLVEMADRGDTYQLVDGAGAVWGGFVIVKLDERRKHLMIDGAPRLIDFTLELRRVA